MEWCSNCKGWGKVEYFLGQTSRKSICTECGGFGQAEKLKCSDRSEELSHNGITGRKRSARIRGIGCRGLQVSQNG